MMACTTPDFVSYPSGDKEGASYVASPSPKDRAPGPGLKKV